MLFLAQFTIRTTPYTDHKREETGKLRLVEADTTREATEKLRAHYEYSEQGGDSASINIYDIEAVLL